MRVNFINGGRQAEATEDGGVMGDQACGSTKSMVCHREGTVVMTMPVPEV